MTKLIRLTAFILILVFPIQQIILANPAFGTPLSGTIENYSPANHNPSLLTAGVDHTLTAKELLKVKGAGWFKKLFKKIAKFFQKVIDAIVKVIQKVMAAITKAFVAVFGKTIGGALAGIVNSIINILTFPVHVAYYASHGDWKGLMKYMGQTLLQVAMIAVQFIPGVGQALGALFQMLGNFIQAIGASILRFAIQNLGQGLLGTIVQSVGKFILQAGIKLTAYGMKLSANTGFGAVKDALKSGFKSFIEKLNPITAVKGVFSNITETLTNLSTKNGLSKLIETSLVKVGLRIAETKIDQAIEKSKMGSFMKNFLNTVVSAGFAAIGDAYAESRYSQSKNSPEANNVPSAPTGLAGVVETIKNIGGFVSGALKDAAGFVKAIFVWEKSSLSSKPLSSGFRAEYEDVIAKIEYDLEGNPYQIRLLEEETDVLYEINTDSLGHHYTLLSNGDIQELRIDKTTKQVTSLKKIGKLQDKDKSERKKDIDDLKDPQYPDDFPPLKGSGEYVLTALGRQRLQEAIQRGAGIPMLTGGGRLGGGMSGGPMVSPQGPALVGGMTAFGAIGATIFMSSSGAKSSSKSNRGSNDDGPNKDPGFFGNLKNWWNKLQNNIGRLTRDNSKLAHDLGDGHAYGKHVIKQKEFPEIKSKKDFIKEIQRILESPKSLYKKLSRGREAWWDSKTKTVVIHDPSHPDNGTVLRPNQKKYPGKKYFDDIL